MGCSHIECVKAIYDNSTDENKNWRRWRKWARRTDKGFTSENFNWRTYAPWSIDPVWWRRQKPNPLSLSQISYRSRMVVIYKFAISGNRLYLMRVLDYSWPFSSRSAVAVKNNLQYRSNSARKQIFFEVSPHYCCEWWDCSYTEDSEFSDEILLKLLDKELVRPVHEIKLFLNQSYTTAMYGETGALKCREIYWIA